MNARFFKAHIRGFEFHFVWKKASCVFFDGESVFETTSDGR